MTEHPNTSGLFSFEELPVLQRLPQEQRRAIMASRLWKVEEAIAQSKRQLVVYPPVRFMSHRGRGDPDWEQVQYDAIHDYAHRHHADPRQKEMLDNS